MSTNYKEIGGRIKQARIARKMNRKKAAERFGYSEEHLQRIENGSRPFNYDLILAAAELYEVDVLYLLNGGESIGDNQLTVLLKMKELLDKAIEMCCDVNETDTKKK